MTHWPYPSETELLARVSRAAKSGLDGAFEPLAAHPRAVIDTAATTTLPARVVAFIAAEPQPETDRTQSSSLAKMPGKEVSHLCPGVLRFRRFEQRDVLGVREPLEDVQLSFDPGLAQLAVYTDGVA